MRKPGQSIAKARDKSEYIIGYSCQGYVDERFRWPGAGHRMKAAQEIVEQRVNEMAARYELGLPIFPDENDFVVECKVVESKRIEG